MHRVPRLALVAVLALAAAAFTPGCAGLTPAGVSPSTAGAPATAGQFAQTVSGRQVPRAVRRVWVARGRSRISRSVTAEASWADLTGDLGTLVALSLPATRADEAADQA